MERHMGQAVVYFEVTGKYGEQLRRFYSELFDRQMNHGASPDLYSKGSDSAWRQT
jgi:hypothetical protein